MTVRYKLVRGHNQELINRMNDSISSLYAIFFNFGGWLGPIFGAALYDIFDFETSMITCGCVLLLMALVYFVFNDGSTVFVDYQLQQQEVVRLANIGYSPNQIAEETQL